MKKKLESELISIAHRILKLKGKEDVLKMHTEVSELYEKLSVLKFAQENFEDDLPTIGSDTSFFEMVDKAFNNKVSDSIEVGDKVYVNMDEVEDDDIMEPVMEKIKDMVAQMPHEAQEVDVLLESTTARPKQYKNDFEDITADFKKTPVFEPVDKIAKEEKKSLNDKLNKGSLKIGLNDKIAFIKHLFNDNNQDYDRVISQLNTCQSFEDAQQLIKDIIKPDYNNWEGKEAYEERLLEIIESKFN